MSDWSAWKWGLAGTVAAAILLGLLFLWCLMAIAKESDGQQTGTDQ